MVAVQKGTASQSLAAVGCEEMLAAIFDQAKVSEAFRNWIIAQSITTTEDFGILAVTEDLVATNIIEPAAKDIKIALADRAAITKAWAAARASTKAAKAAMSGGDGGHTEAEGIPKDDDDALLKRWKKVRDFIIPDSCFVVKSLQKQVWRDLAHVPPRFEAVLIESIRTLDCKERVRDNGLTLLPGRIERASTIADDVQRPIEIYVRIRALLWSTAYISIGNVQWFDFQSALMISEKILHYCTATFKGGHPPSVQYLVGAWASTAHFWQEEVRIGGRNLREVAMAFNEWHQYWTNFPVPSERAGDNRADRGESSAPDMPRELQEMVRSLKKQAEVCQRERDRMANDLKDEKKKNGSGDDFKDKGRSSGDGGDGNFGDKKGRYSGGGGGGAGSRRNGKGGKFNGGGSGGGWGNGGSKRGR